MVETRKNAPLGVSREVAGSWHRGMAAWVMITLAAATVGAAPQDSTTTQVAAAEVVAGQRTFTQFCAPCHGPDGKGRGPAAVFLSSPLPDLTEVSRRNKGEFPLAALDAMLMLSIRGESTAEHAPGQMPAWGQLLRSLDMSPARAHVRVAQILAFLESIQQ